MLKSMKCRLKGHLYVDSRSQPGTQVCVRCKDRKPFESHLSLAKASAPPATAPVKND